MSAIRRTAVLLGLIAAVIIGSSIPAGAAFTASTSQHRATVGTLVVEAPTNITISRNCPTTQATLSWKASATAGLAKNKVTGYSLVATVGTDRITAWVPVGQNSYVYPTGWVPAGMTVPVSVTLTTETQFGWTKSTTLNTTVTTC